MGGDLGEHGGSAGVVDRPQPKTPLSGLSRAEPIMWVQRTELL